MLTRSVLLALLLLAACHSQPTIVTSNATTAARLEAISANTSEQDGRGLQSMQASPTAGQTLDAEPQPPKKQ